MTDNPIELCWQEIVRDNGGFCCDEHCAAYRTIYFAGAMAAFGHATNWNPNKPDILFLMAHAIEDVRKELTTVFHEAALPAQDLSLWVYH
jgi:hypothetical protein